MTPRPSADLPFADVYIDESSHTNHRYLVLGGIIAATADVRDICGRLAAARLPELPCGVMKWTKVSQAKLPAYLRCVDTFFDLQRERTLDFHCLVVDTSRLKHSLYNKGSREIGFNKEVYQLTMKFGRLYKSLLHVYPDRRTTNQSTEDLRLMLNRGIKKHYADIRDWPFRRLQFREPDDCLLLQMTDLLTGAVAFRTNGHHLAANASEAKVRLSQHILTRAGVRDVQRDTAIRGRFTIWHRRLR